MYPTPGPLFSAKGENFFSETAQEIALNYFNLRIQILMRNRTTSPINCAWYVHEKHDWIGSSKFGTVPTGSVRIGEPVIFF